MQDYSKQKALFVFTKPGSLKKLVYVSTLTDLPLADGYTLNDIILVPDTVDDNITLSGAFGSVVIQKPKSIYKRVD